MTTACSPPPPPRATRLPPVTKLATTTAACEPSCNWPIGRTPTSPLDAPWEIAKQPGRAAELQGVSTLALNLFRQLVVYLSPVLPGLRKQTDDLLGVPIRHWNDAAKPLLGTPVGAFTHMMQRLEARQVEAMIEESKQESAMSDAAAGAVDGPETLTAEPLVAERITIDDFTKVDLRVARVIAAEEVPKAKKLIKLTVSLGGDERRTVFAGIKSAYEPAQLVGRLVVVVANLEPRQMTFGLSEGMVVAAGAGGATSSCCRPIAAPSRGTGCTDARQRHGGGAASNRTAGVIAV